MAGCLMLRASALLAIACSSAASASTEGVQFWRFGDGRARPAMRYFRQWHDAALAERLGEAVVEAPVDAAPHSVDRLRHILQAHERKVCATPPEVEVAALVLHGTELDSRGVHHALLLSVSGHFQYIASVGESVLAMDPPACHRGRRARAAELVTIERRLTAEAPSEIAPGGVALKTPIHIGKMDDEEGEKEELLHPTHDALVEDCAKLFERTAQEKCHKDFSVKVLSASLEIIGGLLVRVHAKLQSPASHGQWAHHKFFCSFEPQGVERTAEDLEAHNETDKAIEEEEEGLRSTVIMTVDICDADVQDSVSAKTKEALKLFEVYRTGELSGFKGYRHVYDRVPKWTGGIQSLAELPRSHGFRETNPECFPSDGRRVVRNQGQCGSCWAFTAATALMTNICVAGRSKGSLVSSMERHEVSVQRILSCNDQNFGCEGGHAIAAKTSFHRHRVASERDVPYACGGGEALDHFEKESPDCEASPWGGSSATCSAETMPWQFGGLYSIRGERDMMKAIVSGNALYVSMRIYENFLFARGSVYDSCRGGQVGSHALTAIGYGVDGEVPYWHVQNSWGTSWGDAGFVKIGRGKNLADIEDLSMYFQGWPQGTTPEKPINGDSTDVQEQVQVLIDWALAHKKLVKILIVGFVCAWLCAFMRCCCGCSSASNYSPAPDAESEVRAPKQEEQEPEAP